MLGRNMFPVRALKDYLHLCR